MEQKIISISILTAFLAAMFCATVGAATAQESKETRTLKLRLQEAKLALSQAEINLQKAESVYKEAQEFFAKGLVTKQEHAQAEEAFNAAKLARDQAAINLERTRLAFLHDALHVTLEQATIYRDMEGNKHVALSIKNSSNIARVIDDQGHYTDAAKKGLLQIENMKVKIMLEGKLIGRPFEYRIPRLRYREKRTVEFVLQQETNAVTVEMAYGDTVVHFPVFLQTDAREDRVIVEAMQFSLEGELGTSVWYDLDLERFAEENKTFTLDVLNLPGEFTYEFREKAAADKGGAVGETRISRIRFKKGDINKTMRLTISIPRELPEEQLNKKLTIFALVLDRTAMQRLAKLKAGSQGRALWADDLQKANLSFETLELTPRGRAELTLSASNLFHKVKLGEIVKFNIKLKNTGTVNLNGIAIEMELPIDWTANIDPQRDISLETSTEKQIKVEIIPAADVVVGDYEAQMIAQTRHDNRDIESEEKTLRMQIEGKSNVLLGVGLMVVLIGLVLGVAVMTVKISRR